MRRLLSLAMVALFLLAGAAPLLACLTPAPGMTADEADCCRRMAGACSNTVAPHSCCRHVERLILPSLVTPRVAVMSGALAYHALAAPGSLSASLTSPTRVEDFYGPPPPLLLTQKTVLRI